MLSNRKKEGAMIRTILYLLMILLSVNVSATIFEHEYVDSPYMRISQGDAKLVLESTDVSADIHGVIADVSITQTYINNGATPIEAVYVFPASPSAAVYGLTLNVNGRITQAKIKEKGEAKRTYEEAKKSGKSASLLVQDGPNVFTMNVANILPGDTVKVELNYVEQLVAIQGKYRLMVPASIGPKYGHDVSTSEQGIFPTQHKVTYQAFINSNAYTDEIKSINHPIKTINTPYAQQVSAEVSSKTINKPFVLEYSLRGEGFSESLLVHNDGDEKYFTLMLHPPKSPKLDSLFPREYIFIVDVSGSMNGMPTETSKKLMAELLYVLKPSDLFNIIQFAGGTNILSDNSVPANDDNLDDAFEFIEQVSGGGGTEILPALEKALKMPTQDGYNRSIIVMTDGLVDVEKEAFDLVRKNLDQANLFSFGVATQDGWGLNQYIIEGLARIGQTDPIIITNDKEIDVMVNMFRDYVSQPLLSNISINFGTMDVYDLLNDKYPDIFTQRPLIVTGKWQGQLSGKIYIKGKTSNGGFIRELDLDSMQKGQDNNPAIKYLWAREHLKLLSDYNKQGSDEALKTKITHIGLKYNLLTEYTSFVAVDEVIRNSSDNLQRQALNQPLNVYSTGSGFEEVNITLPISSIDDELFFTEEHNVWVEQSAINKKISLTMDFSADNVQCIVQKYPELEFALNNYQSFIVELNGEIVHFQRKVTAVNSKSCAEILLQLN